MIRWIERGFEKMGCNVDLVVRCLMVVVLGVEGLLVRLLVIGLVKIIVFFYDSVIIVVVILIYDFVFFFLGFLCILLCNKF